MKISICTTNYNCAHALAQHLRSVYTALDGIDFEYIVVDNRSKDRSWEILSKWAQGHRNLTLVGSRCTMGEGREIAFRHSQAAHIMVLDTDVVYSDGLRQFTDSYFRIAPGLCVQAAFCGIFPRAHWIRVGGRRSLNTNEDLDMWVRLWRLGVMRWYPVAFGANLKEPDAWGSSDYMSRRYSRAERIVRLLRREWDLFKTRDLQGVDITDLIRKNTIDLGIATAAPSMPERDSPVPWSRRCKAIVHDLRRIHRDSR